MKSAKNTLRFVALIISVGTGSGVSAVTAQDLPTPTQNALAGAAVFGEKGCIRCHSINGFGQSLGADLRTVEAGRTFQELTAALWNHLPDMSRRLMELGIDSPRLSDREAGDLFAYIYTLGYFEAAGDADRGRLLFTELQCIRCHQVGGVGGVIGPVLDHVGGRGVPIEIAAAMWNHGPAMLQASEALGIPRPALSGRDLTDLLSFLESAAEVSSENLHVLPGDADAGARVAEEKSCTECHGRAGSGGRSAPDLAAVSRGASLIDFVALMWNKTPGMIGALNARGLEFPTLEASEFADVVAYLYSVNYFSAAGQSARGRALIGSKGCSDCHAAADLVSIPGLDHPSSITAALWNHLVVLETGKDFDAWPSFTGREMGDLMAFFEASSP